MDENLFCHLIGHNAESLDGEISLIYISTRIRQHFICMMILISFHVPRPKCIFVPHLGFFARAAYRLHLERAVRSLHHQVKRVILGHHAVALGCRVTGNGGWMRIVASRPPSHGARQLSSTHEESQGSCAHTPSTRASRARCCCRRSRLHD